MRRPLGNKKIRQLRILLGIPTLTATVEVHSETLTLLSCFPAYWGSGNRTPRLGSAGANIAGAFLELKKAISFWKANGHAPMGGQ